MPCPARSRGEVHRSRRRPACLVEVTDEGSDVMREMLANRARAVEPALASWSRRDRKQLVTLLARLAHDLDELIAEENA